MWDLRMPGKRPESRSLRVVCRWCWSSLYCLIRFRSTEWKVQALGLTTAFPRPFSSDALRFSRILFCWVDFSLPTELRTLFTDLLFSLWLSSPPGSDLLSTPFPCSPSRLLASLLKATEGIWQDPVRGLPLELGSSAKPKGVSRRLGLGASVCRLCSTNAKASGVGLAMAIWRTKDGCERHWQRQ